MDRAKAAAGLRVLEQMGLRVLDPGPGGGDPAPFPYLAGTDADRARTFEALCRHPEADLVWCLRGGYGCGRWLPLVDWAALPGRMPLVAGFSDVTFLHAALVRNGRPALHAPLVATLDRTDAPSRAALAEFLRAGRLPALSGRPLAPGTAEGPLVGGNLACLCHLVGTPFEPPWTGAILFIEDRGEPPYRLDRMLTHLRQAGCLAAAAGVAVGRLTETGAPPDLLRRLLADRLSDLEIPVVTDLPAGHGPANAPLLLGAPYRVDGTAGTLAPA
ncbi:LD-carboxypeptidase [Dissulfurirhabdus thermomarina]|uniref:LD-carboxypeptidase n=1 Tax=Dissulfurirhabdus thermomarina TaxID=1765737 RepID=A0A6N9TQR6_DISTH|nr:LD-carboxypeptidase [Dissulfurirhabdus thermomarina]NMX23389.1 LD-carboxypeptidase [Dissulfurirhabdus thermomarina]